MADTIRLKAIPLFALAGATLFAFQAQAASPATWGTHARQVAQVGRRYTPKEIEALIRQSARKYGLPEERVVHIAWRESKFIPTARSKGGMYVGLYQFDLVTWRHTPEGRAGLRREDPVANINAAHWLMKTNGFSAWAVGGTKRRRRGKH